MSSARKTSRLFNSSSVSDALKKAITDAKGQVEQISCGRINEMGAPEMQKKSAEISQAANILVPTLELENKRKVSFEQERVLLLRVPYNGNSAYFRYSYEGVVPAVSAYSLEHPKCLDIFVKYADDEQDMASCEKEAEETLAKIQLALENVRETVNIFFEKASFEELVLNIFRERQRYCAKLIPSGYTLEK